MRHVEICMLACALALMVTSACGEDAPPPPPAAKPAPQPTSVEVDAGEAGVSSATSSAAAATSSSDVPDAAPEAGHPRPLTPVRHDAGVRDAGRKRKRSADAGDGGPGDAGPAHEEQHCSSLGSEGPGELGLCADKFEDWCESSVVVDDCEERAASRDEGVFAAYLDCMDETFADPDLCEGEDNVRIAAAAACAASADATACVEHNVACELYEGCKEYTVGECDANVARFNEQYLRYGAPYFECSTPPSVALGE